MPEPKERVMRLTTVANDDGDPCVRRSPSQISSRRKDVDIVRIANGNQPNSGKSIVITLNSAEAAKLFSPVPDASMTLEAGDSVEWHLRSEEDFVGTLQLGIGTVPDRCNGTDQSDVIISC